MSRTHGIDRIMAERNPPLTQKLANCKEILYICEACDREFATLRGLKVHQGIMHGDNHRTASPDKEGSE